MVAETNLDIYRDTLLAARDCSTDFLLERADALAFEAADPDPDVPGPIGRHLARERLRAIREVVAHRERRARTTAGLPHPHDRQYQEWRYLARIVRERVDIIGVFIQTGYHLHDVGLAEAHAACPVCGGTDRLVIRRDPPGRCWCRQCEWRGDVITIAMLLRQEGFCDTVRWLADLAGERLASA